MFLTVCAIQDLAQVIGKRPILLYYWIAGNQRADTVFQSLQSIAQELGADKLAIYGVAIENLVRVPWDLGARARLVPWLM